MREGACPCATLIQEKLVIVKELNLKGGIERY
jgi:hypothetical protein